jgi:hypothetical protein
MRLAAILGTCLLLPWPCAGIVRSVHPMGVWQSAPQENAPSNSSAQSPADKPPTDPQKVPEPSATPPQAPTSASAPCSANSQPGSNAKPECKPASNTTKTKKTHRTHKVAAPAGTTAEKGPTKTVVRNGGADDRAVDLSPGLNQQKKSQQLESTNELLAASDANLKKISGRQLSENQLDTLKQIKSYMEQAKGALNDDDVQRAHNLAVKANLLSAELAGK